MEWLGAHDWNCFWAQTGGRKKIDLALLWPAGESIGGLCWKREGRDWIQASIKIESCFKSSSLATIEAALTWGINSRTNSLAYLPLAPHSLDRIKSWCNPFWVRYCWEWGHKKIPIYSWGDYWGHWRCQHIVFPLGFSGIWHFPTIGLSGSGTAGIWYFATIEGVKRYCFHPHHRVRIKYSFWVRFCWEWGHRRVATYSWGNYWGHWRCQRVLFPAGFNGIWYFPTIGLELNLDLVLSEGAPRWNAIAEQNKNKIRI